MNRGVFLNLFEIELSKDVFSIFSKKWQNRDESLESLKKEIYPVRLFACEETESLYLFGEQVESISQKYGFERVTLSHDTSPKLTGRLINFGVASYLGKLGYEPQYRDYLSEPRNTELTDHRKPLQVIESRINIYSSFRIQSLFLKMAGGLRFFILIKPRLRYQFRHSVDQIHSSVDCTGKFVRISCPNACNVSDCPVYDLKGRLAGKLQAITEMTNFQCRYHPSSDETKYIQFEQDGRINLNLPVNVCEIEASTANISMIFAARFDQTKASKVISDLRIASGDLLSGNPRPFVNPEVGKRHWEDITNLVQQLPSEIAVSEDFLFSVSEEPVRAIEGGYIPDSMFYDDDRGEEEDSDESDSDIF